MNYHAHKKGADCISRLFGFARDRLLAPPASAFEVYPILRKSRPAKPGEQAPSTLAPSINTG